MALITNIRIDRFALIVIAVVALGANIPTTGSVAAHNHGWATVANPTETVDPPGVYGADAEWMAAIESAIDRFDSVGLTLPELRIYYHSDRSGCQGAIGIFNQDGSGSRVDLCNQVSYTLLHELAHAWEYHTMSDATRQAYLDYTGLASWADPEVDWEDRGIERAAWNIAWALLETPITNPGAFADELSSFELLTGITSPRTHGS